MSWTMDFLVSIQILWKFRKTLLQMDINITNFRQRFTILELQGEHFQQFSFVKRNETNVIFRSHLYKKEREKRSIGLSVLTLLSFLFFLHILQTCLQEQVDNTNAQTPVVIMQTKQETSDEQKTPTWGQFGKNVQKDDSSNNKKASSILVI